MEGSKERRNLGTASHSVVKLRGQRRETPCEGEQSFCAFGKELKANITCPQIPLPSACISFTSLYFQKWTVGGVILSYS